MENRRSKIYFSALLALLLFLAPGLSSAGLIKHLRDTRDPVYKAGLQSFNNRDYASAYRIWLPIATQGNSKAQYRIGYMYLNGLYVRQDSIQARIWFERSAGQGDPNAQNDLGALYLNGQGIRQNLDLAMQWFQRSANQNNATAKYNMGLLYSMRKKYREAKIWFGASAKQGYAKANYRLRELLNMN